MDEQEISDYFDACEHQQEQDERKAKADLYCRAEGQKEGLFQEMA